MISVIKIVVLLFRKFGFRLIYVFIPLYRLFYKSLYLLGFLIDLVLFRKYKKIEIKKPVFLVGHPRSGTTFIHKFIIKNCDDFEGMYLWRMVFPTLTSRFIVKPFLPLINKLFPKNLYDPKIHKAGFLEPETDDAALFFKEFDGMFAWLYFSALNHFNSFDALENSLKTTSKSNAVLMNLKTVFKKNLYKSKPDKRIFSKSFSLILNLEDILNVFPDAKIVILIRDPLEVIPSSLSLARNVQMNLNRFEKISLDERNNYYRNLYNASLIFYKELVKFVESDSSKRDEVLIINYRDFIRDFEGAMDKLINYCEIERTPELNNSIVNQAKKQPNYKGQHEYTLEEFGFTKEEVYRDFDFLYQRFNF